MKMEYACGAVPGSTMRYTSSCGGFSFVVTKGNAQSIWHYDAELKLIGASITQDTTSTSNTCTDSSTHLYGRTCEISGAPVDLCGQSVSPCVRPLDCPDPKNSNIQRCPASPDALLSLCDGEVKMSRSASSCGGSIIHADFGGTHSEDWAFDAANQLVGENYQDDIAARCPDGTQASLSVSGKACAAQGQPEILCDYAPDPGAAGGGAP